ncbi:MAG: transposase, partial [Thaumarchaeota archaeon]|nr:transposase [Nitrososphaerota archaeon]
TGAVPPERGRRQIRGVGRGGVRGHKGGTRIFRPTRTVRHTAERCPNCREANIRDRKKDGKRRIVSIPEFVPHTVTLHRTVGYDCPDCGERFRADDGLPPDGQFDWSVIRYVTYQYGHRKTARMIAEDLENLYGLKVSAETVMEISRRGTRALKPVRDGYMGELEKSPAVIIDETDYEGEPKRWIMAVRDDDTVAYMHAQSRSAEALISQAAACAGIIIRDGYRGYDTVFPDREKQRCTQHVGSEGRNIAERTELDTAARLYDELSKKFSMLRKWTRGRHSAKSRLAYVTKLQKWLRGIISRYRKSRHEKLKKFGTTLENAAPRLFTFVIYPFVHSTTNLGEQSIKQVIGQRNSRLQLKSDRGAESLCIMLSCTETWKLRKLNVWEELRRAIGPSAASDI